MGTISLEPRHFSIYSQLYFSKLYFKLKPNLIYQTWRTVTIKGLRYLAVTKSKSSFYSSIYDFYLKWKNTLEDTKCVMLISSAVFKTLPLNYLQRRLQCCYLDALHFIEFGGMFSKVSVYVGNSRMFKEDKASLRFTFRYFKKGLQ